MKKILVLLVMLAMLMTGCSTTPAETTDACTPGTYTGEATGYLNGKITAEVTVTETSIVEVVLAGENQTEGFGSVVLETFGEEIIAAQSIDIDVMSGASETSEGVLKAVANALDGKCQLDKLTAPEEGSEKEAMTKDVDVVILGAGGAGLVAAIEAADAGKSVLIVEVASLAGGNSIRSTGGMNAAKTTVQDTNEFAEQAGVEKTIANAKENYPELSELTSTVEAQYAAYLANPVGYFDTPELYTLDILIGGGNINDRALVDTFVEQTVPAIDWLADNGIELSAVGSFGGASVRRIHKPVVDGKTVAVGSYMVPVLNDLVEEKNVEILFDTKAEEIVLTDGVVTGVKASSDDTDYTINAKSVVVATGGFGANADLVVKYKPELEGYVTTNAPSIQGDGIVMVEAVGGNLVDIEQVQIHPTVEIATSKLITEGLRGDGAIMVNQSGTRFVDEVGTRNAVSAAIIAQEGSYAYLIVDQKMADASAVIAGYISGGLTVEGETVEELAEAMGVDAATLATTMETWNAAVDAKEDTEFGRVSFAEKLDAPKYYAIKVAPGVHHTMGGVEINSNTEVIDVDGNVIPNLYAAGEVTGGIHGNNRLGGNAVADFVVFGRIAGQQAAANAE